MFDFKEREERILKFWLKKNIYKKVKQKNKGKKKFYFLQGPPYTSGRIHIGHAWNNSMKDIILRFLRMRGFDVWDRAGYDMHGLPTALSVQKKLGLKDKEAIIKFGVANFIEECKKFSVENAKQMDKDLLRLGVWMDYENAYYPITNEFIEGEWWFIKKAFEQKRLYKGKKIMHWCASCETALAKHELEYKNIKDDSIFLKFKIKDKEEYLIIWTTTPWTIPFNLAVMVNPESDYVRAEVKLENKKEIWIVAKPLSGVFISGLLGKEFKIIEEMKGKELEGLEYEHPFYQELKNVYDELKRYRIHRVVLSEKYVSMDAGSGLVHCAPGCGPEDKEVGDEYGLPAFNRIDEKGIFRGMGKFDGFVARKDDTKFVELLKKKGNLIAITKIEHDYPHCWRCHSPVVFRATEQWFLKIKDLVQELLKANKDVLWVPEFGKKAYEDWIRGLKDNSIARQRFWGCPLPIWECECGKIKVIGSIEELKKEAEKTKSKVPKDLHKPWIDKVKLRCECGKEMKRTEDVIDVWIDSGTTSWNCLYFPQREDLIKKYYPADLILEATEQIKLWFSMLNICSMIGFKKKSYKAVYMHGMILDWQGRKMSKSLGNIVSPYEVIDKVGADVLRYYMCGTAAGQNINFSWEEAKIKQRNLVVLRNTLNYLLDLSKEGFKFSNFKNSEIGVEERYILSKLNSGIERITKLFESYRIDETIGEIEKLFLELSRVYIHLIREKVILGNKKEKQGIFDTLYFCLKNIIIMFSTICPFITEEMWQELRELGEKEESVHLCDWPEPEKKYIDKKIEEEMEKVKTVIEKALALRHEKKIGVRWPLKKLIIHTKEKISKEFVELIRKQINVKEVEQVELKEGKEKIELDFTQTKELLEEGMFREFCRKIQQERKNRGLKKNELIVLEVYDDWLRDFEEELKKRVNAKKIIFKETKEELSKMEIKGKKIYFSF